MIQFAQQTNFPNDVTGDAALGRRIGKGNPFNGDNFVRVFLASLVDNPVGALPHHARAVVVWIVNAVCLIVDWLIVDKEK